MISGNMGFMDLRQQYWPRWTGPYLYNMLCIDRTVDDEDELLYGDTDSLDGGEEPKPEIPEPPKIR